MPADEDGYTGAATLVVDDKSFTVQVELRGHFQPIDGYYHWYGRISPHEELHQLLDGNKREAEIRTPEGYARGELSDRDPWGRYRILGTSTPPFTVPTELAELPH
jgi:cell division protein YceG involved in septum cleavage